jgi:hypothetical protein
MINIHRILVYTFSTFYLDFSCNVDCAVDTHCICAFSFSVQRKSYKIRTGENNTFTETNGLILDQS